MTAAALYQDWHCPRGCPSSARTYDAKVPHHPCRGLSGLMVPLIKVGTSAKVETVERGDYIGRENVQLVEGRPVMAIVTTHDDGSQDARVLLPCATASAEEVR